jgi:hypothetical protein
MWNNQRVSADVITHVVFRAQTHVIPWKIRITIQSGNHVTIKCFGKRTNVNHYENKDKKEFKHYKIWAEKID